MDPQGAGPKPSQRNVARKATRRGLTIAYKLALPIAGLVVGIVGFLVLFFQAQQSESLLTQLRGKAATYGQLASAQVRSAVAFDDQETAREVFDSLASDGALLGVVLFTQSGDTLQRWGQLSEIASRARTGVSEAQVFDLGDRVLAVAPVASLEGPRGTLALELSKTQLLQSRRALRQSALLIGGGSLAAGLLLAVLVAQSFARRLRTIAGAAERVAAGDLEHAPAQDDSLDEIGSLSRSFATMVAKVQQLFAEIRQRAESEQTRLAELVLARTRELEVRNGDMRRVLANVDQGFLTIDHEGHLSTERSAIIELWLGEAGEEETLWEYLDRACPGVGARLEFAWSQVVEDFLPLELALDQMPARFESGESVFSLEYKPILDEDGAMRRTLVVITDITLQLESERRQGEERELLQMFNRLIEDRRGVIEFFSSTNELIASLSSLPEGIHQARHLVHTLKGNCAVFGLDSIAQVCHSVENKMAESNKALSQEDVDSLRSAWQRVSGRFNRFVGERDDRISLDQDDYREILQAIAEGRDHDYIKEMVENWKLESVQPRLLRAARQLRAMAARMNKAPLEVAVESNRVRLAAERWQDFWNVFPHLLRNAVDHGLETPEERLAAGKGEIAKIVLATRWEEDQLVIEVSDTGRGVNWEQVRQVATRRGLPCTTHADLNAALFADSVSTRSQVTAVSGRGVGTSAVRAVVEQLGGAISVSSELGKGCVFTMRWPERLAKAVHSAAPGVAA